MASHGEMRKEYAGKELGKADISDSWSEQLAQWVSEAKAAGVAEANAMILATVDEGSPAARTVLMKDLNQEGVSFFTNRSSQKGQQLHKNPKVALCFSWPEIERQVTLRGEAEEIPVEQVEAYWRQRPRESQLGSLASKQSQVAKSREQLEEALKEAAEAHPGEVPLPEQWTGFRVKPQEVEFWQGGKGRMHNRIRLRRTESGQWIKERLWP